MKPFNISADTIVITSSYVTGRLLPIIEVSHDDDQEGGSVWQFHCGNGDYSVEHMQLVRLDTILKIDPSVLEVSDLPVGAVAKRQGMGKDWIIEGP